MKNRPHQKRWGSAISVVKYEETESCIKQGRHQGRGKVRQGSSGESKHKDHKYETARLFASRRHNRHEKRRNQRHSSIFQCSTMAVYGISRPVRRLPRSLSHQFRETRLPAENKPLPYAESRNTGGTVPASGDALEPKQFSLLIRTEGQARQST